MCLCTWLDNALLLIIDHGLRQMSLKNQYYNEKNWLCSKFLIKISKRNDLKFKRPCITLTHNNLRSYVNK